jgi:hypothetical protein
MLKSLGVFLPEPAGVVKRRCILMMGSGILESGCPFRDSGYRMQDAGEGFEKNLGLRKTGRTG